MTKNKGIGAGFGFLVIILLWICFASSTVNDDGDTSYLPEE